MATQRYGLLAFITMSVLLLVWLMLVPNIQAQTHHQLSVSGSLSHASPQASHSTLAHTFDITFTPSFTDYLPLILKPEALGTITGQITYQGAPIGGVSITLIEWYTAVTYHRLFTVTTNASGIYEFTNVPRLTNYYYRVYYENRSNSSAYASICTGAPIFNFAAGASAPGGSFEISDITSLFPSVGATVSTPVVFQWTRRATSSDNYTLYIDGQSTYWDSGQLGYTGQYTLNSLAGTNLTVGAPYVWSIGVKHSDGSGCAAREERSVTFTTTSLIPRSRPILIH